MAHVLPDIVGPGVIVIFCGQAGADSVQVRDHYYETPGNSFWDSVNRGGFSPTRLRPEDDHTVVGLGLGLTDLVGHERRARVEYAELAAKVERWRPEWLALTSKSVAAEVARALGNALPGWGRRPSTWAVRGCSCCPEPAGPTSAGTTTVARPGSPVARPRRRRRAGPRDDLAAARSPG